MPYTIDGKEVIVLGDTTTHGGKVITASETHRSMGIPVARVGDMVECPQCKGIYPIIEGAPKTSDHGKPIARHGDKVACGATLISGSGKGGVLEDTLPADAGGKKSLPADTITVEEAQKMFTDIKNNYDIPFAYKNDCCYARADKMSKIFADSNNTIKRSIVTQKYWYHVSQGEACLQLKSNTHIKWIYHVATVVKVDDGTGKTSAMIFDPSMFENPVSVDDWKFGMVNNCNKEPKGHFTSSGVFYSSIDEKNYSKEDITDETTDELLDRHRMALER
jgi:uncharacterized Zn-binding protein involved in type VI secretion